MIDYIGVPQFNGRDVCEMCIGKDRPCDDLPNCQGVIFVRPEDLPEYHVRFIADRLENP